MATVNYDQACTILLGTALNASAEEATKTLLNSGVTEQMMFSTMQTNVFNAMVACLRESKAPNENFVRLMNSTIPAEYLGVLSKRSWTQMSLEATLNTVAPIIQQCWQERRFYQAIEEARTLPYEQSVQKVLNVTSANQDVKFVEYNPSDIFSDFSDVGQEIVFGLPWLDTNVPGATSRFWAIVAGFKERKTTVLRNLIYYLLLTNPAPPVIAYIAAENTRGITSADFLAMLITSMLNEKAAFRRPMTYEYSDNRGRTVKMNVTGEFFCNAEELVKLLMRLNKGQASVPALITDFLKNAQTIMKKKFDPYLKLFDTPASGGYADTLTGCIQSAARVNMLHRQQGQQMIIALDYLQLVTAKEAGKSPDKLQQMETIIQWGLSSCSTYDALTIFLAQLNSTSNRKGTAKDDVHVDYAPGLPRSSQAVFAPIYDQDVPERLGFKLVAARRQKAGIETAFRIHPVSGLILGDFN